MLYGLSVILKLDNLSKRTKNLIFHWLHQFKEVMILILNFQIHMFQTIQLYTVLYIEKNFATIWTPTTTTVGVSTPTLANLTNIESKSRRPFYINMI